MDFESLELSKAKKVIVDGRMGDIIINPSEQTLVKYHMLNHELHAHFGKLELAGKLQAETFDGYSIRLSANIDMLNEAEMLHQYGGSGVGLFRSKYVFLANEQFPSEEEQYQTYRRIVEKMHGLPIVIRTFDIGADKHIANKNLPKEVNPYLGCRAIRFLLKGKEHLQVQLRAIMRASMYGDVSIMFPMISSLSELLEAKSIVYETKSELESENGIVLKPMRIGCMIEVPSAAIISDLLAKECDFLSIGTNHLVQYALAVDRDNHLMNNLYTPTDPSIIRMIKLIVGEANRYGIPVTVCGEVADLT